MMESNQKTLSILVVAVIFLAAFTAILYVYPYKPVNFTAHANVTNNTNSIKLADFLSDYSINLTKLSDKDLYYFYGGLNNNSIVFGCNYEFSPSFLSSPLLSGQSLIEYEGILRDAALDSICGVENQTNCTAVYKNLTSFIQNNLNSTQIEELFNATYAGMKSYYDELNASGYANLSIVNPLKYDLKLFNSSRNKTAIISAIVKMKEMPVNIVFEPDGKLFGYGNETGIYGPFQFQVYKLLNATACSETTIFNLVTDPSFFSSQYYKSIYSSLGNYTNICIYTDSNQCNSTEMKALNLSFYAN